MVFVALLIPVAHEDGQRISNPNPIALNHPQILEDTLWTETLDPKDVVEAEEGSVTTKGANTIMKNTDPLKMIVIDEEEDRVPGIIAMDQMWTRILAQNEERRM